MASLTLDPAADNPLAGYPTTPLAYSRLLNTLICMLAVSAFWRQRSSDPTDSRLSVMDRAIVAMAADFHLERYCLDEAGKPNIARAVMQTRQALKITAERRNRSRVPADVAALLKCLWLVNPTGVSSKELYSAVAKNGKVTMSQLDAPQVATLNLKRLGVADHIVIQAYNPDTQRYDNRGGQALSRAMGNMQPLDPKYHLPFFHTQECKGLGLGTDPFYLFHARAWALRLWAQVLSDAGDHECPLLGWIPGWRHINVTDMTLHNNNAAGVRYLYEAAWWWQDHKDDEGRFAGIRLPMLEPVEPEGVKPVYNLTFVHDGHPQYYELGRRSMPKQRTSPVMLRRMIEDRMDTVMPNITLDQLLTQRRYRISKL